MHITLRSSMVLAFLGLMTVLFFMVSSDVWQDIAKWANTQQRALQNDMASAIQAIRAGKSEAWIALLTATAIYGFAHALGPGHGKFLIGGIGLGAQVSAKRLVTIAFASSLVQAVWAIVIVYGGFLLLEASAAQFTTAVETYLAPASYLAIAAVGIVLSLRGAKALWRSVPQSDQSHSSHSHTKCGCGGHGPSADEVERATSLREAVIVVLSVGIRPCTGALFLLVIAWQTGIHSAGAAAVIAMGLGTAATTGLVAISSVAARGIARASYRSFGVLSLAAPSLQFISGLAVVWFALALLGFDPS